MLESWLTAQGFVQGAVVDPQTVYNLGAEWYATRFHRDWTRPSVSEVNATFARHGLVGPFWALSAG